MATRKNTVRARARRGSLPIPTDLVSGNPKNELLLDVTNADRTFSRALTRARHAAAAGPGDASGVEGVCSSQGS